MGIRKHFESKPDELKLQDLSLDVLDIKEKHLSTSADFEFGKLLTENWPNLKEKLEKYKTENKIIDFAELAYYLKIIYPEKTASLNLNKSKNKIEVAISMVVDNISLNLIMYYETLFPGQEIPGKKYYDDMTDDIKRQMSTFCDIETLKKARALKSLFPEDFESLELDQEVRNAVEKDLKYWQKEKNWEKLAEHAALLKFLFPKLDFNIKLDTTGRYLEELASNNYWNDFIYYAFNLVILAADKVEVTDQGLEITMLPPESFKSEKKPRPERRNF